MRTTAGVWTLLICLSLQALHAQGQAQSMQEIAVYQSIIARNHVALRAALTEIDNLPSLVDTKNRTPLILACSIEDAESVRILLDAGSPVQRAGAGPGERSPISTALHKGNSEIVSLLLNAGAPVAARDSFGYTPFDIAFQRKHEACISLLFDAMMAQDASCAFIPDEPIRAIDQALCAAARAGSLEWTRKLLDAGAGANAIERRQYTPLICAAIGKNPEVVDLLLARGGDPGIMLSFGQTSALRMAVEARSGAEIVAKILDRHSADAVDRFSVWTDAIRADDAEVMRLLIRKGWVPFNGGPFGDLLSIAVAESKPQGVTVLLEAGLRSEPSGRFNGRTHLEEARRALEADPTPERQQIVEFLEASESKK